MHAALSFLLYSVPVIGKHFRCSWKPAGGTTAPEAGFQEFCTAMIDHDHVYRCLADEAGHYDIKVADWDYLAPDTIEVCKFSCLRCGLAPNVKAH